MLCGLLELFFINFSKHFYEYIKTEKSEQQNSLKSLKNHLNYFKYNIFQNFFLNIYGWKTQTIRMKILRENTLKNMENNQFLKVKNSFQSQKKILWH